MPHYVMVGEGEYPVAPIGKAPSLPGGAWRSGCKLEISVPTPLVYELDADYGGNPKALYYEKAIPIMRDDLIQALENAGVDNIEYFDAVLVDPANNIKLTNYKAFNIIGSASAADMQSSKLMGTSDSVMMDVDFDSLVIDEERAAPFKLFRLAEKLSAIIVDETVKKAIESADIKGIIFYESGDWSG